MFSTSSASSASFAPTATGDGCAQPFATPLPRGLRDEAAGMSRDALFTRYGSASGPLRLGQWACTDADRPATRLGPQARNYQATLAVGDRIGTATASAGGPVAALTTMLYDRGIALEMLAFHQLPAGADTVTFIRGCAGARSEWAMGCSADSTQSALRAVIACANRLLAPDCGSKPKPGS